MWVTINPYHLVSVTLALPLELEVVRLIDGNVTQISTKFWNILPRNGGRPHQRIECHTNLCTSAYYVQSDNKLVDSQHVRNGYAGRRVKVVFLAAVPRR